MRARAENAAGGGSLSAREFVLSPYFLPPVSGRRPPSSTRDDIPLGRRRSPPQFTEKRASCPDVRLAATAVIILVSMPYGDGLISRGFWSKIRSGQLGGTMGDCGKILVVDHDDATRAAAVHVAARLGYEVNAAEDAELLFERLDGERLVLAIVEVELPGSTNGLDLLRELHARFGDDLPVILVSADRNTPLDRVAGLLIGADDYIAKPLDRGELLARVRRSLRRSNGNGRSNGKADSDTTLSPREREILALLAAGKTQKEIASTLVISSKTVATHIQHLLSKLGVHSRAQAVATAFQLGLVEPDVRAHVFVPVLAAGFAD